MNIRFGLIGFFVASLLLISPVITNEVGGSYFHQALELSPQAEPASEEVLSNKLVKGLGTVPPIPWLPRNFQHGFTKLRSGIKSRRN